MAISTNSPEKTTTEQQAPIQQPPKSDLPEPSAAPPSTIPATAPVVPVNPNPNPILNNSQPAPPIQAFAPPAHVSAIHPSFRPGTLPVPVPTAHQFSPIPNPSFQNHAIQGQGQGQGQGLVQVQVQPPGVMAQPPSVPQMAPPHYGQQPMRMYAPLPNGYQMAVPQGTPGILRYGPPPYPQMLRPPYPQRPPGVIGVIPALQRPPVMAMRGPVVTTIVRPPINLAIAQTEKPMTTIYVGKIASTVDNDFMLSLLQLCGPVKSWKRVPDPTTGALKGFGFCEFESVEGVLRALRLLSKLSIDGQQLMLNFDKATKEYLKRFVEKKKESSKATDTEGASKEEKSTPAKPSMDEPKEDDNNNNNNNNEADKENDDYATFGLVTDEDKEADKEASEKLSEMIEERIKNKPLPPPPPPPQTAPDAGGNSTSEHPVKSRDGGDSDADVARTEEDKKDEEMTSRNKPTNENERVETSSPERNNTRSKDRDRAREKERELERYEREREQERARRERDREYKIREEERRYRARLKEWEVREKEKERARKQEREREKDREQDRKYEIIDQEEDDGYSKKRKYRNSGEEREERKRRLREKEEDMEDKIKELEEIAEAKKKEEEEKEKQKEQQKHALEILAGNNNNSIENAMLVDGSLLETRNKAADHQSTDVDMEHGNEIGNKITQNGATDDSETRQSNALGPKKLGFGLVGSGKRTTVPSLFHEEDEDAQKDQKMRPLVPIDYSTEELQAGRETTPVPPSNLALAADYAKRIGERPDSDRDRSRRTHDRSGHRDRDRDHDTSRARDETREREKEKVKELDSKKVLDAKKLLDAKQLIDTIPKTKDELFAYPINWVVYDKNGLQERMRPWISKKITEFLGEEETTLVDYIVSSTQEHVTADEMFERLQSILDDEAEMFVLKMWRMLIFEIKKLESGLGAKSKA